MTWRSDCPLLSLLFLPLPLPSTLTLLFPGSFLLYFLPCSVMVGLGCSVGLFFLAFMVCFFPGLCSTRLNLQGCTQEWFPAVFSFPILSILDLMTRILQSQPRPHAYCCFPLLFFQPSVILFLFPYSVPASW